MNRHFIKNNAGTRLCLHEIESAAECHGTIILAHGTFSNYRSCRGLAGFLNEHGYHCWILDCQGHGFSAAPVVAPDFESMYLDDSAAALDYIHKRDDKPIWWVGHSGGGLAILMMLARNPARQPLVSGVVTVASQATDAGNGVARKLLWSTAFLLSKATRFLPGKLLGIGPEKEFSTVMRQWFRWSITGDWHGTDGFDYLQALKKISIPALTIAAAGDHVIAPARGCRKIYKALGTQDNHYTLASIENGCREDYTHARIISSRNASKDIWPVIADWIKMRS